MLKGVGGGVALRLGWHPFAIEFFLGSHSHLQAPSLVWFIQILERAEFEVWTSMWHSLHCVPLGVKDRCEVALPVLSGGASLPALPPDIIQHILTL